MADNYIDLSWQAYLALSSPAQKRQWAFHKYVFGQCPMSFWIQVFYTHIGRYGFLHDVKGVLSYPGSTDLPLTVWRDEILSGKSFVPGWTDPKLNIHCFSFVHYVHSVNYDCCAQHCAHSKINTLVFIEVYTICYLSWNISHKDNSMLWMSLTLSRSLENDTM